MSNRIKLPKPYKSEVHGSFLGIDGIVSGEILCIESYTGSVPTFSWISDSGHIFCYLPPHAFGKNPKKIYNHVDFICPSNNLMIADFGLIGNGCGKIGQEEIIWDEYIITIDFPEENQLIHLVKNRDKELFFIRNSRFQLGGNKFMKPNWAKAREIWRLK